MLNFGGFFYPNFKATSIGKTVNSLRKSQGEIGKRSKNLVKRWKLLVPSSQAPPPPPSQLSSRSTLVIKKEEEPISQLAPPISNKQKEMVNHSPNVTSLETRKRKSKRHIPYDIIKEISNFWTSLYICQWIFWNFRRFLQEISL